MRSSTIAEDVSKDCTTKLVNSAAASVYCSWDDQDVAGLIASLLVELICTIPAIPQKSALCIKHCRSNRDNEADLSEALHHILLDLDDAFLLIDGLDEWQCYNQRRSRLLRWIAKLKQWSLPCLHVLLTSQHLPDIEEMLVNIPSVRSDPATDILIYVRYQLDTNSTLANCDRILRTEIETFLINNSDQRSGIRTYSRLVSDARCLVFAGWLFN